MHGEHLDKLLVPAAEQRGALGDQQCLQRVCPGFLLGLGRGGPGLAGRHAPPPRNAGRVAGDQIRGHRVAEDEREQLAALAGGVHRQRLTSRRLRVFMQGDLPRRDLFRRSDRRQRPVPNVGRM